MDGSSTTGVSRLSWEQAHRLEVTLRARASRLSTSARDHCPGCGRAVTPGEGQVRLAGLLIHPECLCEEGLL